MLYSEKVDTCLLCPSKTNVYRGILESACLSVHPCACLSLHVQILVILSLTPSFDAIVLKEVC